MHAVAEIVVRQSDDGTRSNARMLVERGFDLGRVNVHAAGQDHVGLAIAQVEEAVGVHPSHVAERLPAAVDAARLRADVAVRPHAVVGGWPHEHFTDFSRWRGGAVGTHDLHLSSDRTPNGAAMRHPFGAVDDRGSLAFGTPVQLPDRLGTEPFDPRLLQPRRARRGQMPDHFERRHVVLVANLDR